MFLALVICVLLLVTLASVLIIEIKKRQKGRKLSLDSNYYSAELPDLKIQHKLLSMMSGDRQAVNRIIARIKQKYPGKTEVWYWEKAIDDLEKDRR
jgi:hypothetical protein